jgi:peptide/nickel transport system substrate-binding protein
MAADDALLVPVSHLGGRLDNDSPTYVFAPDLYLALALAYDSLGAPRAERDGDGVWEQDLAHMAPRLATAWTEEPNGDWTIELRRGVRSHAGNEWTSDDLAWTFEKSLAQDVMAAWRWAGVIGLEGINIVDRYTVRMCLRAPYPTLPNWLISVSPNMVDATAIREHASTDDPWGLAWLDGHVAGYGAYRIEEMDSHGVRFEARADYWDGTAPHAHIDVCPWDDRDDAIAQLTQTRPVVIVGADPDETQRLMRAGDVEVVRAWAGHLSVEIDFAQPPFDDALVRHALAFATPYEEVRASGLHGLARPWLSPVKGVSQWYLGAPLPYAHDPARARALLAQAGHAHGLEAEMHVPDKPYCWRIGEIIAAAWREAGIELTLASVDGASDGWLPPLYLRTECAHNVSEPIYDLAHDYAAMHPLLPLPGGPPHVGNWWPRWKKNPEIIDPFVDMLLTRDVAKKRRQFDDLQRQIVDYGATIFLGEMQQTLVANEHVAASTISPTSRFFQALEYQNATSNYLPPPPRRSLRSVGVRS